VCNFVLENLQHDVVRDRGFPLRRFQEFLVISNEAVIAELLQHATDDLRHADMVAGRII
jgi:hypothetical protein